MMPPPGEGGGIVRVAAGVGRCRTLGMGGCLVRLAESVRGRQTRRVEGPDVAAIRSRIASRMNWAIVLSSLRAAVLRA